MKTPTPLYGMEGGDRLMCHNVLCDAQECESIGYCRKIN